MAPPARAEAIPPAIAPNINHLTRSEERRVGKECRSRWSLNHDDNMAGHQELALPAIILAASLGAVLVYSIRFWLGYTQHAIFFFKQKTAYEIGLGIPAEPLFRSFCSF